MKLESSSFDPEPFNNPEFGDIVELSHNGATSLSYKVRFYNKWHFLKRPKKEYADNPLYIAAFEKEFELGYRLYHPNIVRYLSMGRDAEGIFILTDFVDGMTLKDFVESYANPGVDIKTIDKILDRLCSGLSYLHKHQIIHGDLKPENILITHKGLDVKIIDLGFSYSDCHDLLLCGTPLFSAPEQFIKNSQINAQSDVYSLGKVVEFLFKGRKIPSRYRKIIDKATRQDSCLRFRSIEEISRSIKVKSHRWISAVSLISILFIGWFYFSTNRAIIPPSVIQHDTIHRIDTVFQYVEMEVERKPTEEELLLSEYRGKLSDAHKAAFSIYYDNLPEITSQEDWHTSLQLCDSAFSRSRSIEDSLIAKYAGMFPVLERQLRKIAEEEMAISMSKHLSMQRSYLDSLK